MMWSTSFSPKTIPMTRPGNPKGVDNEIWSHHLELRLAEIEEALEVLRAINDGREAYVAERILRRPGAVGASPRGLDGVVWMPGKEESTSISGNAGSFFRSC